MNLLLLRSSSVEPSAADVIKKQITIDKLQESVFGRFLIKITKTPTDYALRKLSTISDSGCPEADTKEKFIKYMKLLPNSASKHLSLAEHFAVFEYTKEAYVAMNQGLRDPQSNVAKNLYYISLNEQVASAIQKLSKVQNHFGLTFRGLHGRTEHAYLPENTIFTEKAFMSTSLNADVSRDFAKVFDEKNPGTMLYTFGKGGADIAHESKIHGEKEILYKPGTEFKVLFSEKAHPQEIKGYKGKTETLYTNHVIMEEVGTPKNQGHSGILKALDLAR